MMPALVRRRPAGTPARWHRALCVGVASVGLLSAPSLACPVCFSATSERVLRAYHLTAVFMTLLPLLIAGGFGYWLHRRFRRAVDRHSLHA